MDVNHGKDPFREDGKGASRGQPLEQVSGSYGDATNGHLDSPAGPATYVMDEVRDSLDHEGTTGKFLRTDTGVSAGLELHVPGAKEGANPENEVGPDSCMVDGLYYTPTYVNELQSEFAAARHQQKNYSNSMSNRKLIFERATEYYNENGLRDIPHLRGMLLTRQYRHIERALLQREANLALQRADCMEANFADYVHYDLDEYVYAQPKPMKKKSKARKGWKIDITADVRRSRTMALSKRGVIEELVSQGVSPSDVTKLADVFEHPSSLKDVEMSLIPWIKAQTSKGYWRNEASLFILCLTMAISIGNVETMFKLNATWGGMVFLIPYFLAYLLIVQPMMSLEMTTGQLFRAGQSAIYDKLRKGCSGVGTAIVILCLLTGCIACSRSSAEYILYMFDVFKRNMPWRLTDAETKMCEGLLTKVECEAKGPLCHYAEGECISSALGKAYMAYQARFDASAHNGGILDTNLLWAMLITYTIVTAFQILGLATFTFSASMLIVTVLFLIHMQVFATFSLDGATDFLLGSLSNWNWRALYSRSRVWSHSIRSCLYEFIIGNGIYSTLAARSRVGYDLSKETVGVGMVSGYVTAILFSVACALIGFYSRSLKAPPVDIMWMLEQDCNYILLPLGFQTTETMERTLCVLQFGCCVILMCATLAIQIEVAVVNIKDVTLFGLNRLDRRIISITIVLVLFGSSMSLATRSGKLVAWFLEITVGDLGRVFTVLMSSIVVGWLYGTELQKERIGKKCLYTFNTIFWSFNIAASLAESGDESICAAIWWIIRISGIVVAAIAAIFVNKRDAEHAAPRRDVLWWLFFGNIENLRKELCRITPMRNAGGLPMTIFWSACIKWFIPCMLSSTISDILEEIVAPDRIDVSINTVPPGWKFITLSIWAIMVIAIVAPAIMPYLCSKLVPEYTTIDLKRLPSCPVKYSIWTCLLPRTLFGELYSSRGMD